MKQLTLFSAQTALPASTKSESETALILPSRPKLYQSLEEPPCDISEHLPKTFSKSVSQLFSAMAIAEEEIAACKERHPRQAERIDSAFKLLCPPPVLRKFSLELYRAHARELIQRVAFKTSLGPGTKAEVLAALSLSSLDAPLSRVESLLAHQNFRTLFPDGAEALFGPASTTRPTTPDEYVETVELEARLRRRLGRARAMSASVGS